MRAFFSWQQFDTEHGWQIETATGDPQIITLVGPEQPAPAPFTQALPSWSADTPPGSWIEIQLRARHTTGWTRFYRIARWDSWPHNSMRSSFAAQDDDHGHVATDTLYLRDRADMIQPRLLLHVQGGQPALHAFRLALSAPSARDYRALVFSPRELPVPLRSQMSYPNGEIICSPTSVAMLLAYWHAQTNDPRLALFAQRPAVSELVAPRVYDPVYAGHGNWSFNTAFAATQGLDAYVARLAGLEQMEPWIAAGVPVAISVSWREGELANAPIPASSGHLLVVAGFDAQGHVIVADPRGESEEQVRRLYDAAQLEAAWQNNSAGTAYLIHPHGWPVPALSA